MTPLTIAHADFHMHWGGQAEVVLALARCLRQRGHNLFVLAPPGSVLAERAREARLNVFNGCRFKKGFTPAFFRDVSRLRSFLREHNVQIYHCHGSQDHWVGALAARRPTRIVRTRHNIYPIKNHIFNRWLFRKKTAQVITIFETQRSYFTQAGLFQPQELVTLHSPLPQEFVEAEGVERLVRHELRLSDPAPLIGFAANFHPDKAPLDFIAAAEKIAATLPQAHFAMAGHGPLQAEIEKAIQASALKERFHLLGFRKDILQVMASFDLLLITSVAREASSTVAKQALALGIPVVATDLGGTREIVDHGLSGLLVEPGQVSALADAALSILTNRSRAAEMGRHGRDKVRREFSAESIAAKTETIYRRVLGLRRED